MARRQRRPKVPRRPLPSDLPLPIRRFLSPGFLFITVTGAEEWPNVEAGHEHAQTGPNTIVVSQHDSERLFDEDEMMWVDRTDPPYSAFGNYWLILEKQQ